MDVERERYLESPTEEVWTALTDPEELEHWFANEVDLDPRPGGHARFRWDNGEAREAVVEEVEEERRLVLRWLDDDGVVELELEPTGTGTTLRVIETSPEFAAALDVQMLATCMAA